MSRTVQNVLEIHEVLGSGTPLDTLYDLIAFTLRTRNKALIDDAEACKKKMSNASALIDGLGGEKVRWREAEIEYNDKIRRLVGDVLMATGFLSYSGPFNQEFRSRLLDGWQKKMTLHDIPFTENLQLIDMLADQPTIGEWNLQGT